MQPAQAADEASRGMRLGPAERFHKGGDCGALSEHRNGGILLRSHPSQP
jgi:hypothetical protein